MNGKLTSRNEIESWINNQQWYQKISLSNGLETPGKFDSQKRLKFFKNEDLSDKSVLDIGCNSGYYCLWAKRRGAGRVVGIDIDNHRLEQARILAEIENLNIEYYRKEIAEIESLGCFDIIFCFAVLTEIRDIFGALEALKSVIGQKCYIELSLAKPIFYFSRSLHWLKGLVDKKYSNGILEIRPAKTGWMISPSLKVIRQILGENFKVVWRGKGLRYDMVTIERA